MKTKSFILFFLLLLQVICTGVYAANFTVTNTSDSGAGSLRSAIQSANTTPGAPHQIVFNIPVSDPGYSSARGVWTITPLSPLPYITGSNINIDGTSQTTFAGNTNIHGPEIELDGNHNIDYGFFIINGSHITIKGFIIRKFTYGIQISGTASQHHIISGNYVGVNHDASDTSGCYIGIEILNYAGNTMIGGANPEDRNIVSGNHHIGIRLLHSSNNTLYNNYIGTDRTGNLALPNYDGLSLEAFSQNNIIGGSGSGMRNVISGNYAYGLPLIGLHTQHNIIRGNHMGTNAAGTAPLPNTYGILFDDGARYNIVGGHAPGEGNVLSGNTGYGLFIYNLGTTENLIYGNFIGTDATGTFAIPNANGIVIDGVATRHTIDKNIISGNIQQGIVIHITGSNEHLITRNLIGTDISGNNPLGNGSDGIRIAEGGQHNTIGIAPDSGNVIAWNGGNGILIMTAADICNRISGNSIHSNALLGIDLYPEGVTPNDPGDFDSGPNAGMNFPVILSAIYDPGTGTTTITGVLDTPGPETCTVELFLSDGDPSGHGQGKVYAGNLSPLPDGTFTFTFPDPFIINRLCATATDACGNTSEFSSNYILPPPNQISDLFSFPQIRMYPNPGEELIYIEHHSQDDIVLSIISANGQEILKTILTAGTTSIDIQGWASGLYLANFGSIIMPLIVSP